MIWKIYNEQYFSGLSYYDHKEDNGDYDSHWLWIDRIQVTKDYNNRNQFILVVVLREYVLLF